MYTLTLHLHSYLRWLVLLIATLLVVRSLTGWTRSGTWTGGDDRLHSAFVGIVDLQFLAGIALYTWLSPLTPAFFESPGPGMKVPQLRFFMLDHPISMFVAISVLHVWRKKSQGVSDGRRRHKQVALSTLAALLIVLATIPWPGLRYGRVLFRTPSTLIESHAPASGVPLTNDDEAPR